MCYENELDITRLIRRHNETKIIVVSEAFYMKIVPQINTSGKEADWNKRFIKGK